MLGRLLLATTTMTTVLGVSRVHAEVKSASAAGFSIENVQEVPVDVATAWQALVNDVDRWWPREHTWWGEAATMSIDPRAGGCFCEIAGAQQAQHMTITFVDPPRLLRMLGGLGPLQGMGLHGALEWQLEPAAAATRITLRYQVGGYTPEDLSQFAPAVDQVQGLQLGGLADYLRAGDATGPGGR